MPVTDKSQISQDNKGICGFTHLIQMLIDERKLTLQQFNSTYTTSTAFADEWLQTQISHDSRLDQPASTALNRSLMFTAEFGKPFNEISLQELLQVKSWDWEARPGFGLIPEAICDYALRKYGLTMMIQAYNPNKTLDQLWTSKSNNLGHGIYGVKRKVGAGRDGKQITHYVYIDRAGELMTWQSTGDTAKNKLKNSRTGFTEAVVRLYPQ